MLLNMLQRRRNIMGFLSFAIGRQLEVESRIFESLFQRRPRKTPLVAFIRLFHSKCCFWCFSWIALALVVILRCVWPLWDFLFRSYEYLKNNIFSVAFCYWQPFDTLIRGEKNPADCLAVDDVKGVLRDAELDVRKHWRTLAAEVFAKRLIA